MAKIAIIEDDQAIAQMYRMKFEEAGHQVETAGNGKLGLDLAITQKPDIVLLDMVMPDTTGDQVLAKLRQTEWGETVKVVILTNKGEQEVSQAVRDLGVSGIIIKANMTPRHVAEVVEQLLTT
jgi:DNA-binding response OmpR family regulator